MLKLKHHLTLPHFTVAHQLQFAQVTDDDDELIEAIDHAAITSDDNWQLTPAPDTVELERYWTNVVDDIHADPE